MRGSRQLTIFLIVLGSLTSFLYLRRARQVYRDLVAAARMSYGPLVAHACRKGLLLRALCWSVPSRIYHWKQVRWGKRWDALIEEDEE